MIACDYKGFVIGVRSLTIECLTGLVVAEAMTTLYATNFNMEMGFLDVILEGDALQIVKKINFDAPCFNIFGHFVKDIQSGLGSLRSYSFVHVKREANLAAHGLAREATTHVIEFT
jgi:hypothetical protein